MEVALSEGGASQLFFRLPRREEAPEEAEDDRLRLVRRGDRDLDREGDDLRRLRRGFISSSSSGASSGVGLARASFSVAAIFACR